MVILESKQSTYIDYLERYALVQVKIEGNIVKLLRKDGTSFNFIAKGTDGEKGDKGDKGDVGDYGESAYDIAVRLGETNSNLKGWLRSLIGERGPKGDRGLPGRDGVDGIDGIPPNIITNPVVWLEPDQEPYFNVVQDGADFIFTLGLPKSKDGQKGQDGTIPNLTTGTISYSDENKAMAEITPEGQLNVTLPTGDSGEPGDDIKLQDELLPDIDLSVVWIDDDEEPFIYEELSEDSSTKKVICYVPKGAMGDKGPTGDQGKSKATGADAVLTIITDYDTICNPLKGFCTIKISDDDKESYGFSWRTDQETLQLIHTIYKSGNHDCWQYRKGPPTGPIATYVNERWATIWTPYKKKYYTL